MPIIHKCPRCGSSLKATKNLEGGDSKTWKECTNSFCGSLIDNFQPTTMQYNYLVDPHMYKGTFGGFGSGKSFAVIKNVMKHACITPNGYIAIIGFTYKQIRRNFKKDFDEDMPQKLMRIETNQKTKGFNAAEMLYTLENGCKIELITADDVGKIRGLNATLIVILEASNVAFEIFDTSKSRLRNEKAMITRKDSTGRTIYVLDPRTNEWIPDAIGDWMHILLESNPDSGWINKRFLREADIVLFYGSSYNKYQYAIELSNKEYSLHVSATDSNPYLPKNYIEVNSKGKQPHEIKRFFYGSFLFSEDMIYPRVGECLVDEYPIDFTDQKIYNIIGYDYGLSDTSAFVFGVVNFETNMLVIYDELGVEEMSVKEISEPYREKLSIIPEGKLLMLPLMDEKSYSKRDPNKETVGELFEQIGLIFQPVQESVDVRMLKLNSFINNGQLQIFRNKCPRLTEELLGYKKERNRKGELTGKRQDVRNHFADALEFIIIKLPTNLEKMRFEDWVKPGHVIIADRKRKKQTIELTRNQRIVQAINPLGMNYKKEEDYYDQPEIKEESIDEIIRKLSRI